MKMATFIFNFNKRLLVYYAVIKILICRAICPIIYKSTFKNDKDIKDMKITKYV